MRFRRLLTIALCGLAWSGVGSAEEESSGSTPEAATEHAAIPATAEAAPAGDAAAPNAATAPDPEAEPTWDPELLEIVTVVEQLHAALVGVMQNAETLGYQGRYDELQPVLFELFDLRFMAEKSVGRHWKTATEDEQAELVDTFSRFSVANYAGRFHGYTGQSFETEGVEMSARGTKLVRTTLIDPGGDNVQLNYRMRAADGEWRIIDVYLNGTVSELALRRSEYSSLIKREGFQALLAALDKRIDSLATTSTDQAG